MGLTIKQVSEQFDISEDTLRYYEKIGIIPPVTRTQNGHRSYEQKDIDWVAHTKCMRQAGLSVEFLLQYLDLYQEGDATIPQRLELLKTQQKILLEQQEKLKETLEHLSYKISRYELAVQTGKLTWE